MRALFSRVARALAGGCALLWVQVLLAQAPAAAVPEPVAAPCDEFVRWLPGVSANACAAAQLAPTHGRSVKGRVLWRRDVPAARARLRVLVIGGIHGDEPTASTLVMRWIAQAQAQRDAPQAAGIAWRFVPLLNPDGMLRQPMQRTNAHGVDLNRNFPTPDWLRDSRAYWAQRTGRDPRRWPGPSPLSEPETRYLHDELEAFKPHVIVSVHAPYGLLDFDGAVEPPRQLGRLRLDPLGVYPGSLGNYGGVHRDIPVITIELHHATQPPDDAETRAMWADLLAWMRTRLPSRADPEPPVAAPAATTTPVAPPEPPAPPPRAEPASAPAAPTTPASQPEEPPAAQPASAPASGPLLPDDATPAPAPAVTPEPPASAPASPASAPEPAASAPTPEASAPATSP